MDFVVYSLIICLLFSSAHAFTVTIDKDPIKVLPVINENQQKANQNENHDHSNNGFHMTIWTGTIFSGLNPSTPANISIYDTIYWDRSTDIANFNKELCGAMSQEEPNVIVLFGYKGPVMPFCQHISEHQGTFDREGRAGCFGQLSFFLIILGIFLLGYANGFSGGRTYQQKLTGVSSPV